MWRSIKTIINFLWSTVSYASDGIHHLFPQIPVNCLNFFLFLVSVIWEWLIIVSPEESYTEYMLGTYTWLISKFTD